MRSEKANVTLHVEHTLEGFAAFSHKMVRPEERKLRELLELKCKNGPLI